MKWFLFVVIVSLALFTGQAHAQRCLPKMKGIEVRGGMTDGFHTGANKTETGYYFGAGLATYTTGGNKWMFAGEYLLRNYPYRDTHIPMAQFTAEGGFYYNFLSDARKIFFFYIGGSALAGYETLNWGENMLYDGSRLRHKDAFIYGGAVSLEVESYITDRLALLVNVRERILWGGSTGHFHAQFGVGLKVIIN